MSSDISLFVKEQPVQALVNDQGQIDLTAQNNELVLKVETGGGATGLTPEERLKISLIKSLPGETCLVMGDSADGKSADECTLYGTTVTLFDDTNDRCTLVGYNPTVTATAVTDAVGVGHDITISGSSSASLGHDLTTSGPNSVNLGARNICAGDATVIAGVDINDREADRSVILGRFASASTVGLSNLVVIGNQALAGGSNSISVGPSALARGSDQVVVGNGAEGDAAATEAVIIGPGTSGTAVRVVVLGYNAQATGSSAFAACNGAVASGFQSVGLGVNTRPSGSQSMAYGTGATASNTRSLAMVQNAVSSGVNAISIGWASDNAGESALIVGPSCTVDSSSSNAVVLGEANTLVAAAGSFVGGDSNNVSGINNFVWSQGSTVSGSSNVYINSRTRTISTDDNVIIGRGDWQGTGTTSNVVLIGTGTLSGADVFQAVAINCSTVSGNWAVGIGSNASATNTATLAAGRQATASGANSVALGRNPLASGNRTLAILQDAQATGADAYAVGYATRAQSTKSLVYGPNSTIDASSANAIAVGPDITITNSTDTVCVGNLVIALNAQRSVIVGGGNAQASDTDCVVVGHGAIIESGSGNSVVVGKDASLGANSPNNVIVGYNASSFGSEGVVIGRFAFIDTNKTNSVVVGDSAFCYHSEVILIGAGGSSDRNRLVAIGTNIYGAGLDNVFVGHYSMGSDVGTKGVSIVGNEAYCEAEYSSGLGYFIQASNEYDTVIGAFSGTSGYVDSPAKASTVLGIGGYLSTGENGLQIGANCQILTVTDASLYGFEEVVTGSLSGASGIAVRDFDLGSGQEFLIVKLDPGSPLFTTSDNAVGGTSGQNQAISEVVSPPEVDNVRFNRGDSEITIENLLNLRLASNIPATSTSSGVAGTITFDSNYIYVCPSTNSWRRVALSTF